jgi:transcriptional regulator with XRE-family HTH domain
VSTQTGRRRKVQVDDGEQFVALVGEAIRRERLARGMTQARLAEDAELASNHLARIERGEVGATFFVVHRIARALGVDVAALAPSEKRRATRSA